MGGGKTMSLSRREDSLRFCSWLGRALLHSPGLRFNGCSNLSGLIGGTHELALKYGMRDGLTCPVGGRWAVAFWSRRVLCNILTQPCRIMIFAAANFAALRLEQLAGPDVSRIAITCPFDQPRTRRPASGVSGRTNP